MVGSLISVQAVAFYSVPADLVTRMTILPASILIPLFPAFSAIQATGNETRMQDLYARSMKYVALTMALLASLVVVFAHPILSVWIDEDFARNGTLVMQILAVGIFVNSIGFLPSTILQAVGRPDLTAKCYLIETPITALLMWILTVRYGILGTAIAWALRVVGDTAILLVLSARLRYLSASVINATKCSASAVLVAALLIVACAAGWLDSAAARLAFLLGAVPCWGAGVYFLSLDAAEHSTVMSLRHRIGCLLSREPADA
jgi:O-antigen/teichoic acid export membrane protein